MKLHPHNLKQLAAIVSTFGECWIHGDGNMFVKAEHSDFRQEFSNPDQEESKYRAHFNKGDQLPTSLDSLEKIMNRTRASEKQKAKDKEKQISAVTTVKVDVDEPGNLGPSLEEMKALSLRDKEFELQARQDELDTNAGQLESGFSELQRQKQAAEKALQEKADHLNAKVLELEQREKDLAAKESKAAKTAGAK